MTVLPTKQTPPLRRLVTRRRALAQAGAGIAAVAATPLLRSAAQDATPVPEVDEADHAPVNDAISEPAANADGVTPDFVAVAVDRIPAIAQQILDQTGVPGMSVAVVHDDSVVYAGGFGVREIGQDAAVDEETVFQLASCSKPIAATVVSAVVGDGTVGWESRMADVDPSFALPDAWPTAQVTLTDLFSHRSGLLDHAGDILEDLGFSREEVIHRLRYLPPEYSFRAGYEYTNYGLTAAAVAVADSVGTTWEDLSRERLYAPLGMTKTSSLFSDYMGEPDRAIPHVQQGGNWVVTPMQRDPDPQSPAGGVSSTARDVAQWLRLQLGQGMYDGSELIPAAALAPTHRPHSVSHVANDPGTERTGFYGLGMNVGYTDQSTVQWSHSGAFASGAATAVFMLPGASFGVLALTNGAPVGAPEAFCLSVLDLARTGDVSRDWLATVAPVFAAMAAPQYGTGTDWSTPPAAAASALPNAAYLGTYESDVYGDAQIVESGGGLALIIGPRALEFPLAPYDRDTFSWQPIGENASVRSGLTFEISPDGTAMAFRDEYLGQDGPGVLTRAAAAGA